MTSHEPGDLAGELRWFSMGVALVAGSRSAIDFERGHGVRAFLVRLPSGQRYWTVLDADLQVVEVADGFLRHQRFGRDGAGVHDEEPTRAIALFLRWCGWRCRARGPAAAAGGVEQFRRIHGVAGPCRSGRLGCWGRRCQFGGGAGRAGRSAGARCRRGSAC